MQFGRFHHIYNCSAIIFHCSVVDGTCGKLTINSKQSRNKCHIHPFYMQEPTETSQQCSQNLNEDVEEESTVGDLLVLPGPSHQDDSGNMYNSSQSLTPQGSTVRPPSSPPSKTPKKRKQDDPASRAFSLLESIAKRGSSVKEKSAN